jgi:hypothetical protein
MISRLRYLTLLVVAPAAIAAGCGGSGKTAAQTTSAPAAPATHFHAGQPCKASQSLEYSAKGFACVNGKLKRQASQAPTKTNHKAHTTTNAPQGY